MTNSLFAQDKIELKSADKLSGKTIDGQNVREASGNVFFTHGITKIYCNTATQYIDGNKVILTGNVKILQDTLSLYTSHAVYYGNESRAVCDGGVTLKDPKATLTASKGTYYFNESKAIFSGNVTVVNPAYKINSNELTYLRNTEDSFAKGKVTVTTDSAVITADNIDFFKQQGKTIAISNVKIINKDSTIITSDTLYNFSFERKSIARNNVKIESRNNNSIVYGNYLENYEKTNYTFIKDSVRFIQIDKEKETDTLTIYSKIMESFRTKPEHYIARDSVEIIRTKFSSRCGIGIYFKEDTLGKGSISLTRNPVLWQDNMQITGDSIFAELIDKKLKTVYVKKLSNLPDTKISFMLSQNDTAIFPDRYDQISGTDITIHFTDGKVMGVDVYKNSISIYFLYENKKANGMNYSEGENMFIFFDNEQKVSRIRIDKNPKGQYVPENLIKSVETRLPEFLLRTDKPIRKQF
jgi:lipopolysaccharide export system protein LptA